MHFTDVDSIPTFLHNYKSRIGCKVRVSENVCCIIHRQAIKPSDYRHTTALLQLCLLVLSLLVLA